jgi:hypothetical protein
MDGEMTLVTDSAIQAAESALANARAPTNRVPLNLVDETLLTRACTAAALTEAGFPVSPATLATKATRGGGPPYQLFGRKPLYRWGAALAWARSRLSKPVTSTSEATAA